ncbi:hypothetical protein NDU88_004385 [Pleurodeles waltl]|uniref:Uncharacterized protein n=1 Tax=Pleurodeles waltl TaxID=8319 RepID=A0AAV7W880_PLEWA|nr:hypothetical protein NDU88_004385 [Pleurodeles waltl]
MAEVSISYSSPASCFSHPFITEHAFTDAQRGLKNMYALRFLAFTGTHRGEMLYEKLANQCMHTSSCACTTPTSVFRCLMAAARSAGVELCFKGHRSPPQPGVYRMTRR